MYFELLENPVDDPRFTAASGVNIHMCAYDEDSKGRRIVGGPMLSDVEVNQKIDTMINELEEIRKAAMQYVVVA